MKRSMAIASAVLVALAFWACSSPTNNSKPGGNGGSKDSIPTYLSFEEGTASFPENSTLSNAGDNGFFSLLANDSQVTTTASGSGTGDTDATLAKPTVAKSTEQAKVGDRSVKIDHLFRQAHYMVPVADAVDANVKHDVLISSLYLNVGLPGDGTDGNTSPAGAIPGTTPIGDTSPFTGTAYSSGSSAMTAGSASIIDNQGKTVAYKVNVFIPADSKIDKFGLVLYDTAHNPLQSHYQGVVKGQWNRFEFYALGAKSKTELVTVGTDSKAATITSVKVNGADGAAGIDYCGPSFDPSGIRFLGFRVFNTDGSAKPDDALTYFIDDIGWKVGSPVASVAAADVADGTYDEVKTVTLTTSTVGGVIKYTDDGSDPADAANTAVKTYSAPLTIAATTTLKYFVQATGSTDSPVVTSVYTIQTASPTFTPSAGAFAEAKTVVIATTSTPAEIYYTYTSNGDEPADPTVDSTKFSVTPLPQFSLPATGVKTYKVKAMAVKTGIAASAIISATFSFTAGSHTITLNPNYDGASTSTVTVLDTAKLTTPAVPTRANYAFVGWYTDNSGTTAYDFDAAVTSDFTLYAKWKLQYVVDLKYVGIGYAAAYTGVGAPALTYSEAFGLAGVEFAAAANYTGYDQIVFNITSNGQLKLAVYSGSLGGTTIADSYPGGAVTTTSTTADQTISLTGKDLSAVKAIGVGAGNDGAVSAIVNSITFRDSSGVKSDVSIATNGFVNKYNSFIKYSAIKFTYSATYGLGGFKFPSTLDLSSYTTMKLTASAVGKFTIKLGTGNLYDGSKYTDVNYADPGTETGSKTYTIDISGVTRTAITTVGINNNNGDTAGYTTVESVTFE